MPTLSGGQRDVRFARDIGRRYTRPELTAYGVTWPQAVGLYWSEWTRKADMMRDLTQVWLVALMLHAPAAADRKGEPLAGRASLNCSGTAMFLCAPRSPNFVAVGIASRRTESVNSRERHMSDRSGPHPPAREPDQLTLAEDRTILAAERTFASWLRTGLAFSA